MQLTDICVSLELAKQLRKAGYPQDSILFRGVTIYGDHDQPVMEEVKNLHSKLFPNDGMIYYAAPTAAELGEMLPEEVEADNNAYSIQFDMAINELGERWYGVAYKNLRVVSDGTSRVNLCTDKVLHAELEKSEADARAKMWLYLKEHNLLGKGVR